MTNGSIEQAWLYLAESVKGETNKLRRDVTLDEETYRSLTTRISSMTGLTRVISLGALIPQMDWEEQ